MLGSPAPNCQGFRLNDLLFLPSKEQGVWAQVLRRWLQMTPGASQCNQGGELGGRSFALSEQGPYCWRVSGLTVKTAWVHGAHNDIISSR
jgi:hypothetical protein